MSKSGDAPEAQRFNPQRLSFARRRRGFNKAELAELCGVNVRSITAYENSEFPPSEETLDRIADVLSFPSQFFYLENIEEPSPDAGSFRSMSKMTARQRDMAVCQAAIGLQLSTWTDKRYELPSPHLLDLSREPDPEAGAESLRRAWLLGVLPVRNMIHLLESKGIRVFSLSLDAREVDAFSIWRADTPHIFLNTNKTAEHSKYDAAHELGHLVLHRQGSPHGREAEIQANRFASAFLMPRASVLAHAIKYPTFASLVKLKKIWGVSVAALAYRLHELAVISDWQYRGLAVEISRYGRDREPEGLPRESSLLLPKIFSRLREDGITRSQLARELAIHTSELEQLLLGLTMAGIEGGNTESQHRSGNAKLKLVKP